MNQHASKFERFSRRSAPVAGAIALLAAIAFQPVAAQSSSGGNAGSAAGSGMSGGTGGTGGAMSSGSGAASTASDSKLNRADSGMLRDIAQANIAEIETGKVALEKSQSDKVKKFAQMMIDDHTKALGEVQTLAQSKGVKLPDSPDMKHKAVMVEFKALKGDTFDKQYMKQAGVGDHKNTLELLKKTQSNAKDADVKALANKMIPVVEAHLKHAQSGGAM
ncbi:Putative membrane protein (modular protein) [Burkholderiales bacterium 8X]|nr:Putative membrane protein (modular protein) [Burkholderiales bacterium 8X]